MIRLLKSLEIRINPVVHNNDPTTSDLGKKILKEGAPLILELGIDHFNFKKLSAKVDATEASIYRYFKSKHHLLLYYACWYWKWVEYSYVFKSASTINAEEKLTIFLERLHDQNIPEEVNDYMSGPALVNLMRSEGFKVLFHADFSKENALEYYESYFTLCERFKELFLQINSKYKHSDQLASSIICSGHCNTYIAEMNDSHQLSTKEVLPFYQKMILSQLK